MEASPEYQKELRETIEKFADRNAEGHIIRGPGNKITVSDRDAAQSAIEEVRKKHNIDELEMNNQRLLREIVDDLQYHPIPTANGFPQDLTAEYISWLVPLFDNPDYEPAEEKSPEKP
jgi:hypothetical protein